MTILEFLKTHGLECRTPEEEEFMYRALDKIYIEMLAEDAVRMILDYIDNADEIYNDTEAAREAAEKEKLASDEEK